MSVKRRIKRKAIVADNITADAIKELGGILEDTDEIEKYAGEQKDRLDSFVEKMSDKGSPLTVIESISNISAALGEETSIIADAKEKYNKIQEEVSVDGVSKKDKFDLEAKALNVAAEVMQASFNIGTILEDLDKARQTIVNSTTEEGS